MSDFNIVARRLIEAKFQFAKSMPEYPHWYTLSKTWDRKEFEDTVVFIRNNGYVEFFKKRKYIIFALNGYKYWTMGAPIKDTILINKALLQEVQPYDKIADNYNSYFSQATYINEDNDLFKHIEIKGSVLDIGCGDGLLLKYFNISDYQGIEPSTKMVIKFNEINGDYPVINCRAEHFFSVKKYDTIIALYGTASYIDKGSLRRIIKTNLSDNGTAFLMFYKEGYLPETHKIIGHQPIQYANMTGIDFNNYTILKIKNEDLR